MTKQQFFEELNKLLEDISFDEKEEALKYYENYFEDAGKENEDNVLKELISPQKVAASIKNSINFNDTQQKEQGFYTESGYEEGIFQEINQEVPVTTKKINNNYAHESEREDTSKGNKRTKNKVNIPLILLIGIITLPVVLPIIITIVSLLFSVAITVIIVWGSLVITSLALLISGLVVLVIGLIQLITLPALGFLVTGLGLIVFGTGILFTLVTLWLTRTVIPFLYNGIKTLIKLPFRDRRSIA